MLNLEAGGSLGSKLLWVYAAVFVCSPGYFFISVFCVCVCMYTSVCLHIYIYISVYVSLYYLESRISEESFILVTFF